MLKKHLLNAIEKKISVTDCSEFVSLSKNVITPYLISTKSSFLQLSRIHGLDVNDLAIDILADVFQQDEKGTLVNLKNFASSLWTDIKDVDEENIFRAYQSFLRKMADVHVARSYAELDPNGFKIQRNIKETLPLENMVIRKSILGTSIYIEGNEIADRLTYPNIDEIETGFLCKAEGKNTTRELLKIIRDNLLQLDNSRKEINLVDAVRLFKKHYKIDQDLQYEESSIEKLLTDSFCEEIEINQICSNVLDKIKSKIFIDYFSKGKLTISQTKAVINAITDIVYDMVNTGKNHSSFFDYMNKYLEIDHMEYELKFKSKIEYIVKQVKEDLKTHFYTKE